MTTILAMAPLMVIAGFQGKFIRVIPTTAIICLLASFGVAMLIALPLSGFLLKRVNRDMPLSRVDRISHAASQGLLAWINRSVLGSRIRAFFWLVIPFALFVGSL
jgi:multidrug efflux pump subunit AcrB